MPAPLRVFSCFDVQHDADLHARLVQQCGRAHSPLVVVDWSRDEPGCIGWEADLGGRLDSVDAAIVICGEYTHSSSSVSRELGAAREQGKPYVLLRGRRELECTRPAAARTDDCLYTWIWDILTEHIAMQIRLLPDCPPPA